MKITDIRILPPVAVGRLGASEKPLEAFDLVSEQGKPLQYRRIEAKESLSVDPISGEATLYKPDHIRFKDATDLKDTKGTVRPVAPFLEVFAVTEDAPDILVPLTTSLLEKAGLDTTHISWNVRVGNIKIFRRTEDPNDQIFAVESDIRDHGEHKLEGICHNFLDGKKLPLGKVQFIKPTEALPQIRFRFTPASGKVYGASLRRKTSDTTDQPDPVITEDSQVIYDCSPGKGSWRGYLETAAYNPKYTNPAQIFAGYSDSASNQISWGYLDDECDGYVEVCLEQGDAKLYARAHIGAGPPAYAPDTLPVRVVADELEQILLGTDPGAEVDIDEAEDIIRRALETVRLMNTTFMNGNAFEGQLNKVSTMVRQNSYDFGRFYEPIMAPDITDNLAILALHERVFTGLATGAAPWFSDVLRRPEEIGDLSTKALRKMPALMRGADGRSLTLTHRQINTVIKAATWALFDSSAKPNAKKKDGSLRANDNLYDHLYYQALGNPYSVLPRTAISNCFPGLEYDFRNLWRRAFRGITLSENNNYVIDAENEFAYLVGCRLVAVGKCVTMVSTSGPQLPDTIVPLMTHDNPNGVSFMEWSNSLAHIFKQQGEEVTCTFTKDPSFVQVVATADELHDETRFRQVKLTVNHMFRPNTAEISQEVIQPGELTQGLCSPWQNDYRECACYYWAASRPDYVNVEPNPSGTSSGDNWMAKKRTGEYIPDDRKDTRLQSYDDLFMNWQGELNFIIKGHDALGTD